MMGLFRRLVPAPAAGAAVAARPWPRHAIPHAGRSRADDDRAIAAVLDAIGQRVAVYLRDRYPGGPKVCARDLGSVSPATARHWFDGRLPANEHLVLMARRFGKGFLAFVYEPAVGPWRSAAFEGRMERLEAELAALRRDIATEVKDEAETGAVPVCRVAARPGDAARGTVRATGPALGRAVPAAAAAPLTTPDGSDFPGPAGAATQERTHGR